MQNHSQIIARVCYALLAALLAGCAAAPPRVASDPAGAQAAFYVVRRAQHTGIALPRESWPDRALLESFPSARYFEFGWGDARYYPAEHKSFLMALDALFTPSASVMSVLAVPDIELIAADGLVRVPASAAELQALAASMASSFAGDEQALTGQTRRTAAGELRFYEARGSFYFFRMCNRWTVTQLRAAGCDVGSLPVITAGRALREARRCGEARAVR